MYQFYIGQCLRTMIPRLVVNILSGILSITPVQLNPEREVPQEIPSNEFREVSQLYLGGKEPHWNEGNPNYGHAKGRVFQLTQVKRMSFEHQQQETHLRIARNAIS